MYDAGLHRSQKVSVAGYSLAAGIIVVTAYCSIVYALDVGPQVMPYGSVEAVEWNIGRSGDHIRNLRMNVKCTGFEAVEVAEGVILRIPGQAGSIPSGAPDIPVIARVIPGRPGYKARVEVMSAVFTNHHGIHVAPSETRTLDPEAALTGIASIRTERIASSAIYDKNAFWPETLFEVQEAWMGTQKLIRLAFYPIQYNPTSADIRFYTDVEGELIFDAEEER